MKKEITERQKELLTTIYDYLQTSGYPPSFEEMRESLGVASNQSVVDLLNKLIDKGFIRRSEAAARGITLLPLAYAVLARDQLVPFMGATAGGPPLEATEIAGEWQTISPEIAKLADEIFLLKISGDSMINAGIDDGDAVLVKKQKEFVSGDIVLARVGSDTTVKRFMSEDKPPYLYLKPDNPKYDIIYFTEDVELEGKVVSVLKMGRWRRLS